MGWKLEPKVECPPNCRDLCPVFKAFDVHNETKRSRNFRTRNYLAHSALGYSRIKKEGMIPRSVIDLTQQFLAVANDDAIVNPECPGPNVVVTEGDTNEHECNGVIYSREHLERKLSKE